MEKKVTVKDVAREAGVSVATVSYIMNNRTDQKISDKTRKKVLQIANILNYTPSSAAKSLATGRNNLIGIAYRLDFSHPSRALEITGFFNLLAERLNRLSYDVLFMPLKANEDNLPPNRNIDGIITIGLSDKDFRELADNYFIPVIGVDILVDDFLFYQIYSDIPSAIEEAAGLLNSKQFTLVFERYNNENYLDFITSGIDPDNIMIIDNTMMADFSELKGRKIIVIGAYLSTMIRPYVNPDDMIIVASSTEKKIMPDTNPIIYYDSSKKANVTINILLNALDRKFDVTHKHLIN